MWEILFLLVTCVLAWNHWTDQGLWRLALLHRRKLQTMGILLGGMLLYLIAKYYPKYLQHSIQMSQRWIPREDRVALQPMLDAANEFAGIAPARNRFGVVPMARRVSDSVKKQVAAAQHWHCAICRSMLTATYEVDHILRLEFGGSNELNNLQALCPNCHREKTLTEGRG